MLTRPSIIKNRLAIQMVLWFAAISLIPLTIATYFNYQNAARTVNRQVSDNLWAIAQRQSNKIKTFFENKEQFASILSLTPEVIKSQEILNSLKVSEEHLPHEVESIRNSFKPVLRGLTYQYGFTQMYFVNMEGDITLSVGKYSSIYSNLNTGPLKNTPLGHVYQNTTILLSPQFSKFDVFDLISQPTLFIAAPIVNDDQMEGVLVLQIDAEKIYQITDNYNGLGETGETVLGAEQGDNITILNPLHHIPESAFNLYLNFKENNTLPIQKALEGNKGSGAESLDYRDKAVLAAWEYFPKLNWGLVVKIDKDETVAPVLELRQLSIFVGLGTLVIVLAAAILAAGSITQPIIALTEVASRIARGDLTPHVHKAPDNEIGVLSRAIEVMAQNLKSLVRQVKSSSAQVSEFTQELSTTVCEQTEASRYNRTAALEITASAKEISITSKELTGTMQEVNEVAQDTALLAESGIDGLQLMESSMRELSDANSMVLSQFEVIQKKATDVRSIIAIMTKVADQTNLLSLNAAIEARKAKEYGAGFRVVAQEIRRLADQAAGATLEIEAMIEEMSEAVHRGVSAMTHLSEKVEYGVEEIITVASYLSNVIQQVQGLPPRFEMVLQGMESQADGATHIKESISSLSNSAQQTVASLKMTTEQIDRLRHTHRRFNLKFLALELNSFF